MLQYGSDANHLELASVPPRAWSYTGLPSLHMQLGPLEAHTSGNLAINPEGSYDDKSLELFAELRKVQYLKLQFYYKEDPQGRPGKEHGTSMPSLEAGPITPRTQVCSPARTLHRALFYTGVRA